jgi:hypothetical protein
MAAFPMRYLTLMKLVYTGSKCLQELAFQAMRHEVQGSKQLMVV